MNDIIDNIIKCSFEYEKALIESNRKKVNKNAAKINKLIRELYKLNEDYKLSTLLNNKNLVVQFVGAMGLLKRDYDKAINKIIELSEKDHIVSCLAFLIKCNKDNRDELLKDMWPE
ncbi:hypothetical protein KKF34_14345 [Myxococcota bacterium]|nr:hypothetical protein [Myxococcota bacterium]MBU1380718.1 hypothetical protein [Myxococcota bacterium]MBU1498054.1 hypothetical protein [Myxococcota bacterium]